VVEQLKQELDEKGDDLVLIDVREPHEWEIAHIDGARLIPLGQLPDRIGELDGHAEIVTYCHKGSRSMKALEILRGAGFGKVRSLAGGVDAWASRVEPGMARY
jgi:rhodanese-related sulfurtransferase